MTYPQTIDYLFNKLPMYSRIGSAAFKNSLDNILLLCNELGNPQTQFKTIHIAGTNGKGSVSHMLASVLQTSGYKTGLYTSPHLYDFRERIKIDGEMVPEDFVIKFVATIKPLIEKLDVSFFEITVALAFSYFAIQKVNIAVIEVGLGGRLDSTNIILPILSIITNISFDHTNMLGNTLAEIAREKGGIIKQKTPVVIGQKGKETDAIFTSIAQEKQAPIFFAEDAYQVENYQLNEKEIAINVFSKKDDTKDIYVLDLPGIYQTKNIITVLQASLLLQKLGFTISHQNLTKGLATVKKNTQLHGRWEVIHTKPLVVLEVAHNEAGVQQMLEHLAAITYEQLHMIIGAVKDKEVNKVLQLLPAHATYYFTQAGIPRALEASALKTSATTFGLHGQIYMDVNIALKAALDKANEKDLILVCGSIFLVAEVNKNVVNN